MSLEGEVQSKLDDLGSKFKWSVQRYESGRPYMKLDGPKRVRL